MECVLHRPVCVFLDGCVDVRVGFSLCACVLVCFAPACLNQSKTYRLMSWRLSRFAA